MMITDWYLVGQNNSFIGGYIIIVDKIRPSKYM